jgi:hypothetical protein
MYNKDFVDVVGWHLSSGLLAPVATAAVSQQRLRWRTSHTTTAWGSFLALLGVTRALQVAMKKSVLCVALGKPLWQPVVLHG